MGKTLAIHLPVIIACVLAGGLLAANLKTAQDAISGDADTRSNAPLGGLNKFAADVEWMLLINYCGTNQKITPEIGDEIYNRLKRITSLDPNFKDAYEIGAMMISHCAPDKALDILNKGTSNKQLKNNWRIPFLAGFVLAHFAANKDYDRAAEYFNDAMRRATSGEIQAFSSLVYAQSQRILLKKQFDIGGQKQQISSLPQARLCALFDEWRKIQAACEQDTSTLPVPREQLEQMILFQLQSVKSTEPTSESLATVEAVKANVFKDRHLCEHCLAQASPGDRFCRACGKPVEVFGVCPKCSTVLSGRFCSACGTDSAPPQK